MAAKRKSWTEKLDDAKGLPRVVRLDGKTARRWGAKTGDTCVIPAPVEVDALMKQVPRGQVVTINELRQALARRHHATIGCPLTTGIFAWIAAHAAVEADPKSPATPYWRTLKTGGQINPKFPGGVGKCRRNLIVEGHRILRKGTRYFVADYQESIAWLT